MKMSLYTGVTRILTVSVFWGAFVLAHLRKRNGQTSEELESADMHDNSCGISKSNEADVIDECLNWNSDDSDSIWTIDTAILKRVWNVLGGMVTSQSNNNNHRELDTIDKPFNNTMNRMKEIAASIGLPTKRPTTLSSKLFHLRPHSDHLKSLGEAMQLINFYSKSTEFLNIISLIDGPMEMITQTCQKFDDVAVKLLCFDTRISSEVLPHLSSDLDLLMFLDVPAVPDPTLPSTNRGDIFLQFGYCQYQFASFLTHFSTIPSSVTIIKELLCLQKWIEMWLQSIDIRLQLLAIKLQSNINAHSLKDSVSNSKSNCQPNINPRPKFTIDDSSSNSSFNSVCDDIKDDATCIFGPDIFKLDYRDSNSPKAVLDVIFINGMLGSVFHTWRQNDMCDPHVQCWPRNWLSKEFPQARILGVNANLKPFLWNPICPTERMKRRIDQRACDLLKQLVTAGVGQRPIIWICHSAGGILTKELLRISAGYWESTKFSSFNGVSGDLHKHVKNNSSENFKSSTYSDRIMLNGNVFHPIPLSGENTSLHPAQRKRWRLFSTPHFNFRKKCKHLKKDKSIYHSVNSASSFFAQGDSSNDNSWQDCETFDVTTEGDVSRQTVGIVFISTPHMGSQSMLFLYQFPMFLALTPEAKQLQQNSSIVNLHEWFTLWATNKNLRIMNMVENKDTVIHRLYSCRLVPYDSNDKDTSEVVLINADHSEICKPKDHNDIVYKKISEFIRLEINQ